MQLQVRDITDKHGNKIIRSKGRMANYNKEKLKVIRTRDIDKLWENFSIQGWIDGKIRPLGPFKNINGRWKGNRNGRYLVGY